MQKKKNVHFLPKDTNIKILLISLIRDSENDHNCLHKPCLVNINRYNHLASITPETPLDFMCRFASSYDKMSPFPETNKQKKSPKTQPLIVPFHRTIIKTSTIYQ